MSCPYLSVQDYLKLTEELKGTSEKHGTWWKTKAKQGTVKSRVVFLLLLTVKCHEDRKHGCSRHACRQELVVVLCAIIIMLFDSKTFPLIVHTVAFHRQL